MILRRVIEHFRKQEWTAIFLDFVIVVVGVFVGIQVSNWNEARVAEAKARAYLERISADIGADLAGFQDRRAFWNDVYEYGAAALAYAETGDARGASQWRLLVSYFQASQMAEFFTTDATYEELKSAGELRLIADIDLRNRLAQYYTLSANPTLAERPAYRVQVRSLIPLDVQAYIWSDCYASFPDGRQEMLDCKPPIDEARARGIVDAIRGDAELMGALRYWMSTMRVSTIIARDRIGTATALKAAIEETLGNGRDRQTRQAD